MTCVTKLVTSSPSLLLLLSSLLSLTMVVSSPLDTSSQGPEPEQEPEPEPEQEPEPEPEQEPQPEPEQEPKPEPEQEQEPEPEPEDCQSKPKGKDYKGEASTTVTGKKCRPWAQVH